MNTFTKRIGEYLDGKTYTLNGVSGKITYTERQAIYPYPRTVQKIEHEADTVGKQSIEYREAKRMLGDDWLSDITDSECLVNIALNCGMTEEMILA